MRYLLKTEPSEYGIDQLERDVQCVWDGVENALALKCLRAIRRGDQCFIYHTGKEKRIVGLAEATTDAYERAGAWVVDVKFVRRFAQPLALAQMKRLKAFENFDLLRLPRLSVMPVPDAIAEEIFKLAT